MRCVRFWFWSSSSKPVQCKWYKVSLPVTSSGRLVLLSWWGETGQSSHLITAAFTSCLTPPSQSGASALTNQSRPVGADWPILTNQIKQKLPPDLPLVITTSTPAIQLAQRGQEQHWSSGSNIGALEISFILTMWLWQSSWDGALLQQ